MAARISAKGVLGLSGKRVLMVIAPENFRDEELLHTKGELERAKAIVTIASTKVKLARGMFGATAVPDLELDRVKVEDYDAVVFVGGVGAAAYFSHERALSIARDAAQKGKKVCAICIAPVILANAGVLEGRRATVWNGEYKRMLEEGGAVYVNKAVVVDGNFITAIGPQAAREFGRTIAEQLTS